MSDLPQGWEWAHFSDVARVASNLVDPAEFGKFPHIAPNHIKSATGRLLDHQTIAEDGVTSPKHLFYPGQVLYSKIRPYLAKAVTVEFAGLCSADMYPIDTDLEYRFLKWWMLTRRFTEEASKHEGRSVLPKINVQALSTLPVPVPPLAEQRRIVAVLDDHLSRIDASESILCAVTERIAQMRDQYIATACTGGFASVAGISASPPRYVGVQDGELPSLPSNWKWARLAEIADVVGGITKDAKKQADVELPEIPYLRVANVQRGRLDLDRVTLIRAPIDKVRQLRLQTDDVLLNEGGDRDKLGRGWIWEGQIPECIHQNHVFRARIRDNQLEPKLLAWHANTFGRGWCERNGKQSVNLASISLSKIRLLPVPVPPRKDQAPLVALIEAHLADLDQLAEALRRALRRSEHLRRSLLTEAFAGRLAQQDPNDESASMLLKRIKAERARQPKTGRARRTAKNVNPEQESML